MPRVLLFDHTSQSGWRIARSTEKAIGKRYTGEYASGDDSELVVQVIPQKILEVKRPGLVVRSVLHVQAMEKEVRMLQEFEAENFMEDEKPAGGFAIGTGMNIEWQKGPLGRGADRKDPNGAFVETVIAAALQRIEWYQDGEFACSENASAIQNLKSALGVLEFRTMQREGAGVEGTHGRRP